MHLEAVCVYSNGDVHVVHTLGRGKRKGKQYSQSDGQKEREDSGVKGAALKTETTATYLRTVSWNQYRVSSQAKISAKKTPLLHKVVAASGTVKTRKPVCMLGRQRWKRLMVIMDLDCLDDAYHLHLTMSTKKFR